MQVDHFLTICRTFQTTLSCMCLTHALFSLKILICTDILYLCKLLGFSVTPKSVFTILTVARGDPNRLPLAAWLLVAFWEVCGVEGCLKLNVAEFESTPNSVWSGYKFILRLPVSSENSTLSPNTSFRYNPMHQSTKQNDNWYELLS